MQEISGFFVAAPAGQCARQAALGLGHFGMVLIEMGCSEIEGQLELFLRLVRQAELEQGRAQLDPGIWQSVVSFGTECLEAQIDSAARTCATPSFLVTTDEGEIAGVNSGRAE